MVFRGRWNLSIVPCDSEWLVFDVILYAPSWQNCFSTTNAKLNTWYTWIFQWRPIIVNNLMRASTTFLEIMILRGGGLYGCTRDGQSACEYFQTWFSSMVYTVFYKNRGHFLVGAPPCLASSGLALPCLVSRLVLPGLGCNAFRQFF